MHPSEMKNCALIAAARAERDGFIATAEALFLLAETCADEARDQLMQTSGALGQDRSDSSQDIVRTLGIIH
jgi:hypothetical protein